MFRRFRGHNHVVCLLLHLALAMLKGVGAVHLCSLGRQQMYLLDVGSFCGFERNRRLGGRVREVGLSQSEFLLHLAGSINQPTTDPI